MRGEKDQTEGNQENDILPLIRLILREPPPGHDFKTCPTCKQHGIKEL